MKILVTGGCGYTGSILIPKLLNLNYKVICIDTMWFGNVLSKHKNLKDNKCDVYGIKREKKVTEKLSLKPISLYNKVKMVTERILLSYQDKIDVYIVRPATVCGYSKRMRFDVTVNALSYSALKNKIINVNGGSQIRPNIHIEDLLSLIHI